MKHQLNRDKIQERINREGLRPADDGLIGTPITRYMLGWVLSLGILTIVVNLPLTPRPSGIGWTSVRPQDRITLIPMPPEEKEAEQIPGSPITVFIQPEEINEPLPETKKKEEDNTILPEPKSYIQKMERIDQSPILEFVDENPAIIGGLSTLYLRINYPKIARDQGIEGLTVLIFVVEKDGSTSDIRVLKPLHPALDSAAVAAVRKTLFKPGRMEGKLVRVKMRLPIRFRLIDRNKRIVGDSPRTTSD